MTAANVIPSKDEQIALVKAIGLRLREARLAAGLNQVAAAKRLGYANSSRLAKIENGLYSAHIPIWMFTKAAGVYGVSVDYLMCTSDRMQGDGVPSTVMEEIVEAMKTEWARMTNRDVIAVQEILGRTALLEGALTNVEMATQEALEALARVETLNPYRWRKLRGGTRLLSAVERAVAAAKQGRRRTKEPRRAFA